MRSFNRNNCSHKTTCRLLNIYTNNANSNDRCFIARFDANTGFLEWSTKYGVNMGLHRSRRHENHDSIYGTKSLKTLQRLPDVLY